MVAILEWLAESWLGRAVFSFLQSELALLIKDGINALKAWIAKSKKEKQIDQDAKDSVVKLQVAKTKEEIDAGIDDALDKF